MSTVSCDISIDSLKPEEMLRPALASTVGFTSSVGTPHVGCFEVFEVTC